jgi:hypothetical protein
VVLEALESGTIELGIAGYVTGRINEGDSVSRCSTGSVSERISIDAWPPLHRHQPCLSREIVNRLIGDARVELPVDDDHNRDHHNSHDHERLKKQPLRQLHERSVTFFIR